VALAWIHHRPPTITLKGWIEIGIASCVDAGHHDEEE